MTAELKLDDRATPIRQAQEKTDDVQRAMKVASAELSLTHEAIDRHMPVHQRHADVDRALEQNAAVEQKLQGAAQELAEVSDLLAQEVAQRTHLERQLAHARSRG